MIMVFANKISQLREKRKLFQSHLYAALDMNTPVLSQIGRNERPAKRVQVAAKETRYNTKVQA